MVLYIHHDDGENTVNHVTPFLSCLFKLVLFSVLFVSVLFVHFLCYCCFNFRKKFKKHSCALKKKTVEETCLVIVQHPHGAIYVNARLKRNGNNTSSVKEIKNAMQRTRVKSFSIIPTPIILTSASLL